MAKSSIASTLVSEHTHKQTISFLTSPSHFTTFSTCMLHIHYAWSILPYLVPPFFEHITPHIRGRSYCLSIATAALVKTGQKPYPVSFLWLPDGRETGRSHADSPWDAPGDLGGLTSLRVRGSRIWRAGRMNGWVRSGVYVKALPISYGLYALADNKFGIREFSVLLEDGSIRLAGNGLLEWVLFGLALWRTSLIIHYRKI